MDWLTFTSASVDVSSVSLVCPRPCDSLAFSFELAVDYVAMAFENRSYDVVAGTFFYRLPPLRWILRLLFWTCEPKLYPDVWTNRDDSIDSPWSMSQYWPFVSSSGSSHVFIECSYSVFVSVSTECSGLLVINSHWITATNPVPQH